MPDNHEVHKALEWFVTHDKRACETVFPATTYTYGAELAVEVQRLRTSLSEHENLAKKAKAWDYECEHGANRGKCIWCVNPRAESAEKRAKEQDERIKDLIKDLEQGFMQGAYARLKNLQAAESEVSELRAERDKFRQAAEGKPYLGLLLRAESAEARVNEYANAQRIIDWIKDEKRKPANTAFTEGCERAIAYAVEAREKRLSEEIKHALKYLDSLGELERHEPERQMRESFRAALAADERGKEKA